MTHPPKILVFGVGAVGAINVYLLHKSGTDITAVCRGNYDIVSEEGFHIDSDIYGKDLQVKTKVVRSAEEAAEAAGSQPYDLILVVNKAIPDQRTSEVIAPAVTKGHTAVALLQNGVEIEQEYAERFPENPLLTCVVLIPATQTSPGHIKHGNFYKLQVGVYPQEAPINRAAADLLINTLNKGFGGTAEFFENIQEKRWHKLLLNIPWNPLTALSLCRDMAFLEASDGAKEVVNGVTDEVVALAQAQGLSAITKEAAESTFQTVFAPRLGGDGAEMSMLVDALRGQRMEVEAILGAPVRVAKRLGVQVPRIELLYALAKGLDEANRWRVKGESLKGTELRDARAGQKRNM